ncbi:MAG: late competence development ComFB family protein [Gammaproteobacteria bacterium]|nr:late competence development ComFB family protein [Gammaproteobacteria bacterium]
MERSEIHNYYEHLVFDYIDEHIIPNTGGKPDDYFLDIACIALNKLPNRYVRHDVDMAFFLSQKDREDMRTAVRNCVKEAQTFIDQHFESRD